MWCAPTASPRPCADTRPMLSTKPCPQDTFEVQVEASSQEALAHIFPRLAAVVQQPAGRYIPKPSSAETLGEFDMAISSRATHNCRNVTFVFNGITRWYASQLRAAAHPVTRPLSSSQVRRAASCCLALVPRIRDHHQGVAWSFGRASRCRPPGDGTRQRMPDGHIHTSTTSAARLQPRRSVDASGLPLQR